MDQDLEIIMQKIRDGGCNDQTQKEILMELMGVIQGLRDSISI